jgi:hypothetical protein
MAQDIITILGIMDFIITIIILMVLIFDMIIGMAGALGFHMDHHIPGGVITIGDQDGHIGDLITTGHPITTDEITTIHIDLHTIEGMVFKDMKDLHHIHQTLDRDLVQMLDQDQRHVQM